jgi:Flp pilus assembly protein TadG
MDEQSSRHPGERGQVLVLLAGGAITLILVVGLVIDVGIANLSRRDTQNVADITALAGTQVVAESYTTSARTQAAVYAAIDTTSSANDCTAGAATPCTWQAWFVGAGASGPTDLAAVANTTAALPAGTLGVRVAVNEVPRTFFIGVIGMTSWDVNSEATAIASRPGSAPSGQLLPIALRYDAGGYEAGQVYDLTDGKDAPGGFGYLSWTGSNSAGALATSLCTPDNPAFSLPRSFVADPGKTNANDVRACLDDWINTGQTVLIPIYDTVTGTGNNATYHIIGLAAFVLTAAEQPAVDNIRGYFVEVYPYTDVPAGVGSLPPTLNDTSYFLGLVR